MFAVEVVLSIGPRHRWDHHHISQNTGRNDLDKRICGDYCAGTGGDIFIRVQRRSFKSLLCEEKNHQCLVELHEDDDVSCFL